MNIQKLKECLLSQMNRMLDSEFTTFQCGMAIGADLMFAQAAFELKKQYSSIVKFIAVIPCIDHDKKWSERDRLLCREIIEKADEVVIVSNCRYYNGCMAKRNRYLADSCDELLSIYDGQRGGTMQTINYAKGRGLKVTMIDPTKELIIVLHKASQTVKSFKQQK
jgi:uncharacterized phage-like protein YoqJ